MRSFLSLKSLITPPLLAKRSGSSPPQHHRFAGAQQQGGAGCGDRIYGPAPVELISKLPALQIDGFTAQIDQLHPLLAGISTSWIGHGRRDEYIHNLIQDRLPAVASGHQILRPGNLNLLGEYPHILF